MPSDITITIGDAELDSFCKCRRYKAIIDNPDYDDEKAEDEETNPVTIDNPESKLEFFKRHVKTYVIDCVMSQVITDDTSTAKSDAEAKRDALEIS